MAKIEASRLKGIPIPGANLLDEVLSRFLNQTDYTGAIFDYLRGSDNGRRRSDNLDVTVLDRDNVKNIINTIKTRYQGKNHRRYYKYEAYYAYPETNAIKETALDMMKQSIYATKFRMNETRRFRKWYEDDISFHIAVYYGALMQISTKMETLFTIIKKLKPWTHFLWFLVIYEKILAANVDCHDMVDRIFDLHDKYQRRVRGEKVEIAPTIPTPTGSTRPSRERRTRTRPSTIATTRPAGFTMDRKTDPEYGGMTFERPDDDDVDKKRSTKVHTIDTEEPSDIELTRPPHSGESVATEAPGNKTTDEGEPVVSEAPDSNTTDDRISVASEVPDDKPPNDEEFTPDKNPENNPTPESSPDKVVDKDVDKDVNKDKTERTR